MEPTAEIIQLFDEYDTAKRSIDEFRAKYGADVLTPYRQLEKEVRLAKRKVNELLTEHDDQIEYDEENTCKVGRYTVKRRTKVVVPVDQEVSKEYVPSEKYEEYIDAVSKTLVTYVVQE